MEIARERPLPATPDEVAALVSDLERWPEWFALHKGWSGDVPSEAGVGTRFTHKVRVLGVAGDVTWEVVEIDMPGRFVLRGKGPSRTGMGLDVGIAPHDAGALIAFEARVSGFVLRPVEGMLRDWLDVRVERTLDGLERLLAG